MTRNSKKTLKSIIALILVAVLFTAIFFTIKHFDDEKNIPKKEQATQNKNDSASASSAIEIRINILEDHIASTQSQLKALSENTEDNNIALIQKMNELSKQLLEAQSALSFLTEEFNQSTLTTEEYYKLNLARIQSIEDSLIEIRANMSELTAIKNKIQILEENIKALIERLDNMVGEPGEVEAIRQKLAVVQAEYNLLLSEVDTNSVEIQTIKTQLDIIISKLSNVSNPNILINGDFQINQRGVTSLTNTSAYSVDRWFFAGGSNVSFTKNPDGTVTLTNNSTNDYAHLQQYVEAPERYAGMTLTMSVCVVAKTGSGNANLYIANGIDEHEYIQCNNVGITSATKTFSSLEYLRASIVLNPNSSITIKWIKLEVGSISTAFTPRTMATELADCQRFFISLGKAGWSVFGNGYVSNSTTAIVFIQLPIQMRVIPEFSYSGIFRLSVPDSAVTITKITIDKYASTNEGFVLNVTASGLSTSKSAVLFGANNSSAHLVFDAEIY